MAKGSKHRRRLGRGGPAPAPHALASKAGGKPARQPRTPVGGAAGGGAPAAAGAATAHVHGGNGKSKRQRTHEPGQSGNGDAGAAAAVAGPAVQHEGYWDSMAKRYDKEIYDSYHDALNKELVTTMLDSVANPEHSCIDFGCGVGKYLPALSSRFACVLGVDLSQRLLDRAAEAVVWSGAGRSRRRVLRNVELAQADLATPGLRVPEPADFGCCQNVLLEPDGRAHEAILANVRAALKPGAALMLLVPSLESALHVAQTRPEETKRALLACRGSDVVLGRLPREKVLTQHFLRTHVERLLRGCGFDVLSCERLEYQWRHEVGDSGAAERASEAPPWDWLVMARRKP